MTVRLLRDVLRELEQGLRDGSIVLDDPTEVHNDLTSTRSVVCALLLTDFETVDDAKIESWTQEQRKEAVQWATLESLSASDNDVARVPCPPHVEALRDPNAPWTGTRA